MIAVINYGVGNIGSVLKAFEYLDIPVTLTADKKEIKEADGLILPGVGAFGSGMKKLKERNLVELIKKEVEAGKPLLGICLGLQLLFSESEESPGVKGLDLIKGKVKKFKKDEVEKIPHMGWNNLKEVKSNLLLEKIKKPRDFYFIHSYYVEVENKDLIISKSIYGKREFASLVRMNNIWGIQPHPEKSSKKGLELLNNFARKVILYGNNSSS
ncbi:MAG: imidazole glycerol phosphate synthase subunit HisH [Bacillota bacterium]